MAVVAHGPASVGRGVAVKGEGPYGLFYGFNDVVKGGVLVLCERLGWEEVERTAVGLAKEGVEDRNVVAERLARGGRCGEDDVFIGSYPVDRVALVSVGAFDAAPPKSVEERWMKVGGVISPRRFSGRTNEVASHVGGVLTLSGEIMEDVVKGALGK